MEMSWSSNFFNSICKKLSLLFILLTLIGSSCFDIIKLCSAGNQQQLINVVKCIDKERNALVAFKEGLSDPSGRLSSWVGEDCCNWTGIACNNVSGHVIKLDLRHPNPTVPFSPFEDWAANERTSLGGEINSSLLQLKYLNYLDLSSNDFRGRQIPKFLGMLQNLRYLNLSSALFSGEIPPHLGNLSSLNFLDVGTVYPFRLLNAKSLHWLRGLHSLNILNMGGVNLNSVGVDWLQAVNMPSLTELHLPWCELQSHPLSLSSINFTSLSVMDLSLNWFDSLMPLWLFNLTSLKKLDLSYNSILGPIPGESENLMSLEELDLSHNKYMSGQLPGSLGKLCNLKVLTLGDNSFSGETNEFFSSFSSCPTYNLVSLDISSNGLEGNLPDSLGMLKNLRYLDLTWNSFWGSIPPSIGNLSSLLQLDLSWNSLWGSIPPSIGNLSSLQQLDLSYNQMNGTIPESFGNLSELVRLDLHSNNWTGVITEAQLKNLRRLEDITVDTQKNLSFVFNVTYDWVPPFRLQSIDIRDCQVGPKFPVWLQVQSELTSVELINVGISDTIPEEWFSKLSSRIYKLSLSHNQIVGKLPYHQLVEFPNLYSLDLSYNRFEGPIPLWSKFNLNLQNNRFSGPIPSNIGQLVPNLTGFYLSENNLSGQIPSSIGQLRRLQVLSVRNNQLFGKLPHDWSELQLLMAFDVANNNISGKIPTSMGSLASLKILLLSNNSLDGEIPSSLQNCSNLASIDLGENKFSGNIPLWLGEIVMSPTILRLRSNFFDGNIPPRLCNLSSLHLLDVAHNKFSGVIPDCLDSLTALVHGRDSIAKKFSTPPPPSSEFTMPPATSLTSSSSLMPPPSAYVPHAIVVSKGAKLEYSSTLEYVNLIDFSGNNLTGGIPEKIASLCALGTLNLSMNHLSGKIPEKIGNLRWLETLDLSSNNLSGPIPQSISSLTSLNHFNLSYNNLVGRIPSGNQLQTLNDSSYYEGNPLLCGVPLSVKCPGDDETNDGQTSTTDESKEDNDDDKHDSEMFWFYISIGPGFVVGFWGVCGTLLLKKRWRHAYFQFSEEVGGWVSLMIALRVASLRRRMGLELY